MHVGEKLAQVLGEFEKHGLCYGRLSLETVCYLEGKISLELPLFATVTKELELLEKNDKQGIGLPQDKPLKADVRSFLEMMIKLAV